MRGAAPTLRAPEAARLFAALGDETRLRVVARLCEAGPASIVRLTAATKVSRQAVTKHLAALAGAGLVDSERRGRERVWEIRPAHLEAGGRYLDHVSRQWDAALERLRAFVERP